MKSKTPPCDNVPAQTDTEPDLKWFDVRDIGVEGKGWVETEEFYDRLPARAKGSVREPVWDLGRNCAGLSTRFTTDAQTIHARWEPLSDCPVHVHMAATGVSGVDLYARDDSGAWRWLAIGKPEMPGKITVKLIEGLEPTYRQYMLYLPLYNGVKSVEIGLDPDAAFEPIAPRVEKPIIFYGTSIVQGGCASRPGMAYPSILGRRLDRPIINLGFSGNGQSEPELAELLAELDGCAYVIDAVANMTVDLINERIEPLVRTLRKAHPDTPIVLVEDPTFTNARFLAARRQTHADNRAALRGAYDRLTSTGINRLHYVKGTALYGDDGEATVDGAHPTDVGFIRMADIFEPILKTII